LMTANSFGSFLRGPCLAIVQILVKWNAFSKSPLGPS
jgi:hypothetical protein